MRDVCPKLEDEIRIDFEKRDIREVLDQVATILGAKLPYEVPEGVHLVERSEVHGMPADRFLDSVARVCGLALRFETRRTSWSLRNSKTRRCRRKSMRIIGSRRRPGRDGLGTPQRLGAALCGLCG